MRDPADSRDEHFACRSYSSIHGPMDWTTPSFEEIKMDAEIGSYQADEERESDRAVGLHAGPPLRPLTSLNPRLAPADRSPRPAPASLSLPDPSSPLRGV